MRTEVACHEELMLATVGKKRKASLENVLVESFVLTQAIAWESFVHDLVLAYIEDDSSKFCDDLKKRMDSLLRERFGPSATRVFKYQKPRPSQLPSLADPKGWNITAKNSDDFASLANRLLPAATALKFSLARPDRTFLDFFLSMRNYLSHLSDGARSQLRTAHSRLDVVSGTQPSPNLAIAGDLQNVAIFLKSRPPGQTDSRAISICNRVTSIAAQLA